MEINEVEAVVGRLYLKVIELTNSNQVMLKILQETGTVTAVPDSLEEVDEDGD